MTDSKRHIIAGHFHKRIYKPVKGEESFSFLRGSWNSNVRSEKHHPVCEQAYPCAQGTPLRWQLRRFVFTILTRKSQVWGFPGLNRFDHQSELCPGPSMLEGAGGHNAPPLITMYSFLKQGIDQLWTHIVK